MTLALYGKSNRRRIVLIVFALLALLAAMAGGAVSLTGAHASTTASLKSSHVGALNPGFTSTDPVDCSPTPPSGEEGWWAWHFVLPGNDTTFQSLNITFKNYGSQTVFVSAQSGKGAYVYTPGPDKLASGTAQVNGTETVFNLSHVCPGTTRVIRLAKTTATNAHPATTFPLTVSPANGTDLDTSVSLALNTHDSTSFTNVIVSTAAQTVTETTPLPSGWSLQGYKVVALAIDISGAQCNQQQNPFTQTNGSTVVGQSETKNAFVCISDSYAAKPNLTATKTDDTSNTVSPGGTFHWTIVIANTGSATADFSKGDTILQDDLPAGASYSVANPPTSSHLGGTGSVDCQITGSQLLCKAAGSSGSHVTVPTNGSITVVITATVGSGSSGTLTNPATGSDKRCMVDPTSSGNGSVVESNETDNTCSDSVTIVSDRTLSICKVVDSNGQSPANEGGTFSFTITPGGGQPIVKTITTDESLAPTGTCLQTSVSVPSDKAITVAETGEPAGWNDSPGYPKAQVGSGALTDNTASVLLPASDSPATVTFHDKTSSAPQHHYVTLYKAICPSYPLVPANENQSNGDDTGGQWPLLDTTLPPHAQLSDVGSNCALDSGWYFRLFASDPGHDPVGATPLDVVGPTDAQGAYKLDLDKTMGGQNLWDLVNTTGGLWVKEYAAAGTPDKPGYTFGALRCYYDSLNGDNDEFISAQPGSTNSGAKASDFSEGKAICIAFNVGPRTLHVKKSVPGANVDSTAFQIQLDGTGSFDVSENTPGHHENRLQRPHDPGTGTAGRLRRRWLEDLYRQRCV